MNDQSGMVDDISDHIERTADRTRDANVQLRKVCFCRICRAAPTDRPPTHTDHRVHSHWL